MFLQYLNWTASKPKSFLLKLTEDVLRLICILHNTELIFFLIVLSKLKCLLLVQPFHLLLFVCDQLKRKCNHKQQHNKYFYTQRRWFIKNVQQNQKYWATYKFNLLLQHQNQFNLQFKNLPILKTTFCRMSQYKVYLACVRITYW